MRNRKVSTCGKGPGAPNGPRKKAIAAPRRLTFIRHRASGVTAFATSCISYLFFFLTFLLRKGPESPVLGRSLTSQNLTGTFPKPPKT